MQRQDDLAFLKALSCFQVSPATLNELRKARKKRRPVVTSGRRITPYGSRASASQQLVGKRKAIELASLGDSTEPAHRRPAPGAGPSPLPATETATGEQAASGSRQPAPSGVGATYAAVLSASVAPQPSGTLKPTAMGSDPSESIVSMETSERRMSQDMYGPLSGTPDGTTNNAHVANACIPARQRPNKTPIFISGVSETRGFLAWLRASCPGGLMAQLQAERLMVVPSTADGFRATITALRSLDGKEGVSFHTFTLPEDRCVPLLVKNLGRGMPESVVREELEALNIRVQGVTQLRCGHRDQGPAKDRPPTPTPSYQWREDPRCLKCDHSPNSADCECRWSRTWLQRDHCNVGAANASATRSSTADTHNGASLVGTPTSPVDALPRGNSLSAAAAGVTTQRTTATV